MNVDRVISLLKILEGWREFVYDDRSPWPRSEVGPDDCYLSGGQWKVRATGGTATIGYGETEAEFVARYWGKRITQAEALAKMGERVQGFYRGVRACIDAPLTVHQWEAVTCRAYQTGAGGFCRSRTAALLSGGDIGGALGVWRSEFAHPDRSDVEIAHFLTPDEERPMQFVSRAEWGARPARGRTPAPGMTRGVGVHWLGEGGTPRSHAECPGTMRWIQALHMDTNGWVDFAYGAGACPHGVVFEGRGPGVRNAANGGGIFDGADANAAFGAVVYFDSLYNGVGLTDEGRDAINDAAEWLKVANGKWLGHQDFTSTGCPGDELYAWAHAGHPRGNAAPAPTPIPEPEDDMSLFIYDHLNDAGQHAGTYYADGYTKWGVDGEEMLAFWSTGKVIHLGSKPTSFHRKLRWRDEGLPHGPVALADGEPFLGQDDHGLVWIQDEGRRTVLGPLETALAMAPSIETGDPGCGR